MKYLFIVISSLFFVNISAQNIDWMSLEQALEMQKKNPKNIIIDVYTNWCGPCKLLDKNTFQNKKVAVSSLSIPSRVINFVPFFNVATFILSSTMLS